jgi:hypothetical protein
MVLTFLSNIRRWLFAFKVNSIFHDDNDDDFDINLKLGIEGLPIRSPNDRMYGAIAIHAPFGIVAFGFVEKLGFGDDIGRDNNGFSGFGVYWAAATNKKLMIGNRESENRSCSSEEDSKDIENLHG